MAKSGATVACIGGSLSRPSRSLRALDVAAEAAREAGAETRILDILALDLPFYRSGREPPERARAFAETVHRADGLIWSSPMYHGTVSGSFKNALDWLLQAGGRVFEPGTAHSPKARPTRRSRKSGSRWWGFARSRARRLPALAEDTGVRPKPQPHP
jgi:NAD(P)H-dependent FMN reductase